MANITRLDVGFCYITLHFRMFAILQQLNLIPPTRLLPSLMSFIPFSSTSPMELPPLPTFTTASVLTWTTALLRTSSPLLVLLTYGQIKYAISQFLYRPIYQSLPRPVGESMFAGMLEVPPLMEYDTPDHDAHSGIPPPQEQPSAPVIELPTSGRSETQSGNHDSDEEEVEISQASLISFDVEPTESMEPSVGQWSAELRSAQEQKSTGQLRYRVTGITMLPAIMATEVLREVVVGALVLPMEALMVRLIARAYQASAGLSVDDIYSMNGLPHGFLNLLSAFCMQAAISGLVWMGFTWSSQKWVAHDRRRASKEAGTVEGGV